MTWKIFGTSNRRKRKSPDARIPATQGHGTTAGPGQSTGMSAHTTRVACGTTAPTARTGVCGGATVSCRRWSCSRASCEPKPASPRRRCPRSVRGRARVSSSSIPSCKSFRQSTCREPETIGRARKLHMTDPGVKRLFDRFLGSPETAEPAPASAVRPDTAEHARGPSYSITTGPRIRSRSAGIGSSSFVAAAQAGTRRPREQRRRHAHAMPQLASRASASSPVRFRMSAARHRS